MLCWGVEIPFTTFLTWSYIVQDKLEITIYLSWDKFKTCLSVLIHFCISYSIIIMNSQIVWKTVWILISLLLRVNNWFYAFLRFFKALKCVDLLVPGQVQFVSGISKDQFSKIFECKIVLMCLKLHTL